MKQKTDPKNNKKARGFQPHFRKAYNGRFTGHPQYVYDDDGRRYKVLGITSSPKTNGVLNVRLERNPEPNNSKPAYVRTKTESENKGAFGERLKGWTFSEKDKKKVREIIYKNNNKK